MKQFTQLQHDPRIRHGLSGFTHFRIRDLQYHIIFKNFSLLYPADKVVVDFDLLLLRAVIVLYRRMHHDLLDQCIQHRCGQFGHVIILPDQRNPLPCRILVLALLPQRRLCPPDLVLKLCLLGLVLRGQHLEVVLCDTLRDIILIKSGKQPVHLVFSLFTAFQLTLTFPADAHILCIPCLQKFLQKLILAFDIYWKFHVNISRYPFQIKLLVRILPFDKPCSSSASRIHPSLTAYRTDSPAPC